MKILLAEDDRLLGDGVCAGLTQEGFTVDWVEDGRHALTAVETGHYDLLILDLGLPGLDGMDVLRRLRARQDDIPILILTARDTLSDRVGGLDNGADDYMVKPFDLEELCARVRALSRRKTGHVSPVLTHGALRVDPAARQVTLGDTIVELSGKEYALLLKLLENRGRVLSRSMLEEALYSWGEEVGSNVIEVHIHNLRKKIGQSLIRTIRGVGYTIDNAQE